MVLKWVKDKLSPSPTSNPAPKAPPEPWREFKTRVFSTRDFNVPIVGESNYQAALRRSKDGAKDYSGTAYVTACIAREPDNPYDSGAVKVMNGQLERHRLFEQGHGERL